MVAQRLDLLTISKSGPAPKWFCIPGEGASVSIIKNRAHGIFWCFALVGWCMQILWEINLKNPRGLDWELLLLLELDWLAFSRRLAVFAMSVLVYSSWLAFVDHGRSFWYQRPIYPSCTATFWYSSLSFWRLSFTKAYSDSLVILDIDWTYFRICFNVHIFESTSKVETAIQHKWIIRQIYKVVWLACLPTLAVNPLSILPVFLFLKCRIDKSTRSVLYPPISYIYWSWQVLRQKKRPYENPSIHSIPFEPKDKEKYPSSFSTSNKYSIA